MRLLFLDQFSDPGGAQRMLLDLLPAVRERGWTGMVALPGRGKLFESIEALGFRTARIDCGPYESGRKSSADILRFAAEAPRLARQIGALCAELEPELVYINGPRLLPAAAMARITAPVLFHAHIGLRAGPSRWLAGISLGQLNAAVIAVCRHVADSWGPFSRRVSVVYNGVAGPDYVPSRTRINPPAIGCIGRISPEKGQREFVAAARQIHRALPDCRFIVHGAALFGDRAARQYEDEVRAAAGGLPVEFAGWTNDVYAALAHLELLLVPSVWDEPNPRVILEAFAAGVPVLAFRAGGIPEIVEHGRTGFLCGGPGEMADFAIDLLTAGPGRLTAVWQAARSSWERHFTLERWRRDMLAAVQTAAGAL